MIDGIIDLSHHQESVDLGLFAASGGLAVILKATQGSGYIDRTFPRRLLEAWKYKLLVGAYHFCDASSSATQARLFTDIAGRIPGVKLFLDIEENYQDKPNTVTVAQAADIATRVMKITGNLPETYTGRYQPDRTGKQWGKSGNPVLNMTDLWVSHYTIKPQPTLVPGWKKWMLWQWRDDGEAEGIEGPVDHSRFNGTAEELTPGWLWVGA
jgi:lysozyme